MMRRKHTPQLQIDNASKIKADELRKNIFVVSSSKKKGRKKKGKNEIKCRKQRNKRKNREKDTDLRPLMDFVVTER